MMSSYGRFQAGSNCQKLLLGSQGFTEGAQVRVVFVAFCGTDLTVNGGQQHR